MKKLILSVAIILGSLSIYASTNLIAEPIKIQADFQTTFTEIALDTVPAAIKTALESAYPGATLEKACKNENNEYKLEIAVGEQKAIVYSDAEGNWLKI